MSAFLKPQYSQAVRRFTRTCFLSLSPLLILFCLPNPIVVSFILSFTRVHVLSVIFLKMPSLILFSSMSTFYERSHLLFSF